MDLTQFAPLDKRTAVECQRAVGKTFRSFFGLYPQLTDIREKVPPHEINRVSGVMPIFQDNGLIGVLKVAFNSKDLGRLMTKLYKTPLQDLDPRVVGGVGEVTNIIFGMLKGKFNAKGSNFEMCVPCVLIGGDRDLFISLRKRNVIMTFEYYLGSGESLALEDFFSFQIEILFSESPAARAPQ